MSHSLPTVGGKGTRNMNGPGLRAQEITVQSLHSPVLAASVFVRWNPLPPYGANSRPRPELRTLAEDPGSLLLTHQGFDSGEEVGQGSLGPVTPQFLSMQYQEMMVKAPKRMIGIDLFLQTFTHYLRAIIQVLSLSTEIRGCHFPIILEHSFPRAWLGLQ